MDDRVERRTLVAQALDALLAAAERPTAPLTRMAELVCESGLADQAHFYLVDADDIHLRLAAVAAGDPAAAQGLRAVMAGAALRIDTTVLGRAASSPDPVMLNDLQQADLHIPPDFREHIETFDVQHMVAVQVPGYGRTLGALLAARTGDGLPFAAEDVALLERVATVSAFALDRAALLGRVARQADILDRVGDAVVAVDENQVVTKWNHAAEALYEIPRPEALGRPLRELFTTVSHERSALDAAWGELSPDGPWHEAVRQLTRDGLVVEVDAIVTPLVDRESGFAGAVAVNRDVSQALRAQRALAERQAFAEAVLDALPGRTVVLGVDGQVRAVNRRYEHEGPFGDGAGSGPGVGADALAFLDLLSHGMVGVGLLAAAVRATLGGSDAEASVDVLAHDDRWTAAQAVPFLGAEGGALVTFLDVSDRKAHELELAHRATHDALTGLPNRALLLDRLREALGRASRRRRRVAVMFIDLDGLKSVNDTAGHAAGDAMIIAAADRLAAGCRVIDTVARLGGDEFVVLLDEVDDTVEAEALAHRMLDDLRASSPRGPGESPVGPLSASIGVVLAEGSPAPTEREAADLVGHADAAMLVAKKRGKAQVALVKTPMPPPAQPSRG